MANTFFNCALARFNVPKNVQDIGTFLPCSELVNHRYLSVISRSVITFFFTFVAIKRGFITADDEIPDEIKKVGESYDFLMLVAKC